MIIPDRLVDFVHGAVLTVVGTRDARLRPSITWVFGARGAAGSDDITVFVPDIEIDGTRRNLDHNGVVHGHLRRSISNQAYQFKGKFLGMRPTTDEERAVQEIHRDKVTTHSSRTPRFRRSSLRVPDPSQHRRHLRVEQSSSRRRVRAPADGPVAETG